MVLGPIGPWSADATCSKGQVVRRGGVGGKDEGWHQCVVGLLSCSGTCPLTNEEGWWLYCPIG